MKDRCYNKNNPWFHRYGGRGIAVDKRWLDTENGFINFYEDMYKTWFQHATLDRIDVDGHYHKDNCEWVTNNENVSRAYKGRSLCAEHKKKISKVKLKASEALMVEIQTYLKNHTMTQAIKQYGLSKSTINRRFRELNLVKPKIKKASRYPSKSIITKVQKVKSLITDGYSLTKACSIINISRQTYNKYKGLKNDG